MRLHLVIAFAKILRVPIKVRETYWRTYDASKTEDAASAN